jgi:hypothetical protein
MVKDILSQVSSPRTKRHLCSDDVGVGAVCKLARDGMHADVADILVRCEPAVDEEDVLSHAWPLLEPQPSIYLSSQSNGGGRRRTVNTKFSGGRTNAATGARTPQSFSSLQWLHGYTRLN